MINITLFDTNNAALHITATPGQSLMAAATHANVDGIAADCGGTLTCATCHDMVRSAWVDKLPEMTAEEADMLNFAACSPQPNSRLSCQIMLSADLDGLEVDLPANQY